MSTDHLDPARSVIRKRATVVSVTGKHVSRIYRWMYARERGGTGGLIPQPDATALLAYARANEIALGPGDFFNPETGRES